MSGGLNPGHLNLVAISLIVFAYFIYVSIRSCFTTNKKKKGGKLTVGLFHPYCNAGGGGERVLWVALRTLQSKHPDCKYFVYTGDVDVTPEQMIQNAKSRFNITINPSNVEFIYLKTRHWVEAEKYPSFTLFGQSIGSFYMGLEALSALTPDIFIDTMGYAFTLPLFKTLGGCQVGCYVHYPTISTDMLDQVSNRAESYNNPSLVAKSPALSTIKLVYYKLFARLYSCVGRSSDVVMVNSSWTQNHINSLWQIPSKTFKVYPPCDVKDFKNIPLKKDGSSNAEFKILSVAQFRPEKDHALQLRSVHRLKGLVTPEQWAKVRLILIGSVRNEDDEMRVRALEDLRERLDLKDNVEFLVNVSFDKLKEQLASGEVGLHTMWNEHFGISIVECMAAGLIMVAHKSGGPLMDIVQQGEKKRNGFLATEETEYAEVLRKIMSMNSKERSDIRSKARESVARFSEDEFSKGFLQAVNPLFR